MPAFNCYTVVAFDLRQSPILDLGTSVASTGTWQNDRPAQPPYPPTISQLTWPRSVKCDEVDYPETNGINLLWLPDAQITDRNAISVAFSLRTADAAIFEKKSWVLPIDEGFLNPSFGWRLLGYDVADAWLSRSCFYQFGLFPKDAASVFEGMNLAFNKQGLIDDEDLAIRIAERLTPDIVSHYHCPFYPVRIWVQQLADAKSG